MRQCHQQDIGGAHHMAGLPVHSVNWTVLASGVAHVERISAALAWISGTPEQVMVEKERSYHGSAMHIISVRLERRSEARAGVIRLGADLLRGMKDELNDRIDEDNNLHVRLCLDSLVSGEIALSSSSAVDDIVKGRIKLEVYPGSTPVEVAEALLTDGAERAAHLEMPPELV